MSTAAPTPSEVVARAPGKINVFFSVGGAMEDGYHEVASAYQAVSLYEDVRARPADDFSVRFAGGSIDTAGLPVGDANLAIRAAKLLATRTGHRGGVALEIAKNVPIAGGMGGGSADAAATLVACDALWGTGLARDELHELAARLGADVPFALTGGTAVGTGRGDELSPALAKGVFSWVLAFSESGLSTPVVYRELDRHRALHASDISPAPRRPVVGPNVLQALRAGDAGLLAESMENDLQAAALHLAPELADVLEIGESSGALGGIVSGSGPTLAFLTADTDAARQLQAALAASGSTAILATGPVHGTRVLSAT